MERPELRFPVDAWSAEELESELLRSQIVETKALMSTVSLLSPAERAVCGECLLLRRINRSRERAVRSLLEEAEDELSRSVRRVWLSCAESELVASSSRRACDAAQREVERLEQEIRSLAAERVGLEEEILDTLRSVSRPRRADARPA